MTALQLLNKDFDRFFVGYDDMMRRANDQLFQTKSGTNYPPYNIKKTTDTNYVIEMAVAGFSKEEIEIQTEGKTLTISGNIENIDDGAEVIYSGLALRPFTRNFSIADQVQVLDAELVNGVLKVKLEKIIPEEDKPKTIKIS